MSRILSAEQAGTARAWAAPDVASAGAPGITGFGVPISAAELEALQARAYQEAYDRGLAEGLAAGREQVRQKVLAMDALAQQLVAPLQDLDPRVERELLEMAFAIARQLIYRELTVEPAEILPVVREAMDQLPVALNEVRIRLNPADAELVRSELPRADSGRAWAVIDDPAIHAGGCLVESRTARVDARVETRLAGLMAEALGEEVFPMPEGGR